MLAWYLSNRSPIDILWSLQSRQVDPRGRDEPFKTQRCFQISAADVNLGSIVGIPVCR